MILLQNIKRNILKRRLSKKFGKCGSNLDVFGKPTLISPENIEVGDGLKINEGVYISASRSKVIIGNDVTLSPFSKIIGGGYELERFFNSGERVHHHDACIKIGNHVWVCAGAMILANVEISGEYVIIGAGAVVTHDIKESNVIVAGVPAKVVRRWK